MASNIDATKPVTGAPTTASVRTNFATAKTEIEALQTGLGALTTAVSSKPELTTQQKAVSNIAGLVGVTADKKLIATDGTEITISSGGSGVNNIVVGSTAPNNADGQPDGTVYIQTV